MATASTDDTPPITLGTLAAGMRTAKVESSRCVTIFQRSTTLAQCTSCTLYCAPEIHARMHERKQRLFREHDERALRGARSRANPFETIANALFQNRAAMKMAELDAVSGWLVSDARVGLGM